MGGGRGGRARRNAHEKAPATWTVKRCQPMFGIEHEAVEEVVGYWVGAKGEKYRITDRWKIFKVKEGGGEKAFDIHWHADTSTIRWGDDLFFDPVELYSSVDSMRWFAADDPEKTKAVQEWSRSDEPFEELDENGPSTEEARDAAMQHAEKPVARRTRKRGKALKSGDIERQVKLEFAGEDGEEGAWDTPPEAAASEQKSDKKKKPKAAERATPKPKALGTQPSDGFGFEVLEHMLGVWDGPRGETYTMTEKWSCTKTDWKGNPHVFRNLLWDDESQKVLWGQSFVFDAADLESVEESGELHWYKARDYAKKRPAYTWTRK